MASGSITDSRPKQSVTVSNSDSIDYRNNIIRSINNIKKVMQTIIAHHQQNKKLHDKVSYKYRKNRRAAIQKLLAI